MLHYYFVLAGHERGPTIPIPPLVLVIPLELLVVRVQMWRLNTGYSSQGSVYGFTPLRALGLGINLRILMGFSGYTGRVRVQRVSSLVLGQHSLAHNDLGRCQDRETQLCYLNFKRQRLSIKTAISDWLAFQSDFGD